MDEKTSWVQSIDALFGRYIVDPIGTVIFFDVAFWDNGSPDEVQLPIVVLWLVLVVLLLVLLVVLLVMLLWL